MCRRFFSFYIYTFYTHKHIRIFSLLKQYGNEGLMVVLRRWWWKSLASYVSMHCTCMYVCLCVCTVLNGSRDDDAMLARTKEGRHIFCRHLFCCCCVNGMLFDLPSQPYWGYGTESEAKQRFQSNILRKHYSTYKYIVYACLRACIHTMAPHKYMVVKKNS